MVFDSAGMIETLERTGGELEFMCGTTLAIQEAKTPDEAIQQMIERVCAFRHWPVGHAYRVSQDGELERMALWHSADADQLARFRTSIEALPVSDGIGLAARAFALAKPQWTRGLCETQHTAIANAAQEVGITTAFAFPVSVNMTVKAIVEFFSHSEDAPEQPFLEIMSTLCIQLGRTLERQQMAELEATNRELTAANTRLHEALAGARQARPADERGRNRFLTNMGHEFRTPITTILGFSELLLAEAESTGQKGQSGGLGRIHHAAGRLLELVNGIIDLSRVEAREMELNIDEFGVEHLVQQVCESMRESFRQRANVLKVDCRSGVGEMHTDSQKVSQCLTQLITNANKFTENGVIELEVSRLSEHDGERIVFRVTDTGIGMTPEQVVRLFQPFSQADSSAARRYGGIGLGLALTESLVKMLGGSVRVDSVLGEGTTFSLELPPTVPAPDGTVNNKAGVTALRYG